jgi:hypothetical protein
MKSWYPHLNGEIRVLLSDTGYINSDLAMEYLDHLILHSNATIERPKVLLMDQHGSHMDPNFIIKATSHYIYTVPFPGHLTHVLQPLDVAVFQAYKHWHRKAIQHAIRSLDIDYNVASFFRDIGDIRKETFKKGTIQGAFRKSGMWPINVEAAIQKMKIYSPPELEKEEPTLPLNTPKKFSHAEQSLTSLDTHLKQKELSSPTQRRIDSSIRGSRALLLQAELKDLQLQQLQMKVTNQQKAKTRSRSVVQKFGALTGEEARAKITQKEAEKKAQQEKKRQYLTRVTRNRILKELHTKGVKARKQERSRCMQLKKLYAGAIAVANIFIPPELLEPIPDPEKEVKEEDIELQLREALITMEEFSGVSFPSTESEGPIDPTLEFESQQDYISFTGLDTYEEEEMDTGLF